MNKFFYYYNIPSNNRELQPSGGENLEKRNYNIPSNNRELQRNMTLIEREENYNIPSNNRELQLMTERTLM